MQIAFAICIFFASHCLTRIYTTGYPDALRSAEAVNCVEPDCVQWTKKGGRKVSNARITGFAISKECNAKRCDGRGRRFEKGCNLLQLDKLCKATYINNA